jgi:deoxyribodipyrimidine photo-lyase
MPNAVLPAICAIRVRTLVDLPYDSSKAFVLYWMTAYRRTTSNFALQRAVQIAEALRRPLVILESLRCNYRWASDRFHQFILDGMQDNAAAVDKTNAFYCGYVESESRQGHGLLEAFAKESCCIVSDDFPCFFHPALYERIARKWNCCVELVDSNTIIPMRTADRTFTVAHSYRRYMQKEFHHSYPVFPLEYPLQSLTVPKLTKLPKTITERWELLVGVRVKSSLTTQDLSAFPIDHSVSRTQERGGQSEGRKVIARFVSQRLGDYAIARNEPEQQGSSWLAPYLHFGHVSPHEVFAAVTEACRWNYNMLAKPNGKMDGFWNMGTNAEAFIDQLLTWREIGFNMCWRESNYDRYESLPAWAQTTLREHENDKREWIYDRDQFETSRTHDPLWNAAQRQLVQEGRIHNYLRMLWGKKILHWSGSPRDALKTMIHLNNKYALDGRDPNSYSGIFWVLGRYDRAWGPERPIFGKVRYMTSESTQNKFEVRNYLKKYSS